MCEKWPLEEMTVNFGVGSSAKCFALVPTLVINRVFVHWQTELLYTPCLALGLLPPFFLAVILCCRRLGSRTSGLNGVGQNEVDRERVEACLRSPGLLGHFGGVGDCRHRHELQVRVQ